MEDLFKYLSSIHSLSKALREYLPQVMKVHRYAKYEYLVREGQISRRIWFLRSGIVRFFYTRDDEEVTVWFIRENEPVLVNSSFFDQRSSEYFVQALETCDTYYIDHPEMMKILRNFPEAQEMKVRIIDFYTNLLAERVRATSMHSAEERYRYLEEHLSYLVNRIPHEYQASFLDMDKRTLRKVRARKHK